MRNFRVFLRFFLPGLSGVPNEQFLIRGNGRRLPEYNEY